MVQRGRAGALVLWSLLLLSPAEAAKEKLAYIHGGNLWMMDIGGAKKERLSRSGTCSHPDWSPDGTRLVFVSHDNIWMMRLADRRLTRLTTTRDCHQPAWRPGHDEVWYFRRAGEGSAAMWKVDTRTGAAKREFSTRLWGNPNRTSWRSDGNAVVFTTHKGGSPWVHYLDVRREPLKPAWSDTRETAMLDPAWSPVDGHLVAVGDGGTGPAVKAGLWVLNRQDKSLTRVLEAGPFEADDPEDRVEWPEWAQGRYAMDQPGPAGITVEVRWPTWGPKGLRLAFEYRVGDETHLWGVDYDGGNPYFMTDDAHQPTWSPELN